MEFIQLKWSEKHKQRFLTEYFRLGVTSIQSVKEKPIGNVG